FAENRRHESPGDLRRDEISRFWILVSVFSAKKVARSLGSMIFTATEGAGSLRVNILSAILVTLFQKRRREALINNDLEEIE
ncbi:MAG: hypothetical protein JWM68_5246, partial [Verrucomicrobiales bacterium]|nr:hypothetical protein [Verrucomicrobiales bacterium]